MYLNRIIKWGKNINMKIKQKQLNTPLFLSLLHLLGVHKTIQEMYILEKNGGQVFLLLNYKSYKS